MRKINKNNKSLAKLGKKKGVKMQCSYFWNERGELTYLLHTLNGTEGNIIQNFMPGESMTC